MANLRVFFYKETQDEKLGLKPSISISRSRVLGFNTEALFFTALPHRGVCRVGTIAVNLNF